MVWLLPCDPRHACTEESVETGYGVPSVLMEAPVEKAKKPIKCVYVCWLGEGGMFHFSFNGAFSGMKHFLQLWWWVVVSWADATKLGKKTIILPRQTEAKNQSSVIVNKDTIYNRIIFARHNLCKHFTTRYCKFIMLFSLATRGVLASARVAIQHNTWN